MVRWFLGLLGVVLLLMGCTSPDLKKQLDAMQAKQDSILVVLNRMESQSDFVAKKVGWQPPEDTLPKEIPLANSHYYGADNPVLTLVEFSDFQCPYCAGLAPTLDSLVRSYPQKVRVVFKHFPLSFHKQARSAHAAALAAGKQGKFFEYRYLLAPLFKNLGDSLYIALAEQVGLDMEQFKADMPLTPEINQLIDRDMKLGQSLGVRGTPTLYANGKKVNDRSFRGLEKLVQEAQGS